MKTKCEDCVAWYSKPEYQGRINGQCRFNPPANNKDNHLIFPMISSEDWCCKFKRKNPVGGFW